MREPDHLANLSFQPVTRRAQRKEGSWNRDFGFTLLVFCWIRRENEPFSLSGIGGGVSFPHRESTRRPFRRRRAKRRRPPRFRIRRRNPWTFFLRKLDFRVSRFFMAKCDPIIGRVLCFVKRKLFLKNFLECTLPRCYNRLRSQQTVAASERREMPERLRDPSCG